MNMNTLAITVMLTLMLDSTAFVIPRSQPGKKDRPTKLARYQTGVYPTPNGTKLHVNIDKELGGRVTVQLNDRSGNNYFSQTLSRAETKLRLNLDLTELADGDYLLRVSNGLEREVRALRITTRQPTITPRSITMR